MHVELKGREKARMSQTYGSQSARKKVFLGKRRYGRGRGTVPEHWKLKILASARQTVVPQSLFDKPSSKHLIFSEDDEEG
jgi:hypothetical protein